MSQSVSHSEPLTHPLPNTYPKLTHRKFGNNNLNMLKSTAAKRMLGSSTRERSVHAHKSIPPPVFSRVFQSRRLKEKQQKENAAKKKAKEDRVVQAAPCSLSQNSQSSGSQGSQPPCVQKLKRRAKQDMEQRALSGECDSDLTSPSLSQGRVGSFPADV